MSKIKSLLTSVVQPGQGIWVGDMGGGPKHLSLLLDFTWNSEFQSPTIDEQQHVTAADHHKTYTIANKAMWLLIHYSENLFFFGFEGVR